LNYIRVQYKNKKNKNRLDEIEKNLIEFQYRFESCSSAHAKSDGYKFYLLYNNALNCLVRMIYWANDGMDYSYLPPDFLTRYGHSINFLEHDGSMFLPKGNEIKRRLLDRLAYVIPILTKKYQIKTDTNAILSFCERVYNRDYFWNFRDIATYNPYLKHNIVFRSTSLTKYQDEIAFVQLQNQYGIKHIIDLRTDDEVEECQYKEDILNSINYIRACIDPRIQSDSFKSRYNTGTNVEIAYAYYAVECCGQIRLIADSILKNEGATVIHCVAGRDRTGIIISLLHLLSGAGIEIVYNDYLASGQNTNKNDLKIFLNIVQETGGIIQYLKHCGLTEKEILHLKSKITL
jgi:protein tyrosine/serine phosphatase